MAEPPVPADGNPSTEDPGENKPWDELFVNNPDEYFGNTNSQKESRPKIGDPKEVALHTYVTEVARPRGTKVRREIVLIRVLNSLGPGGNKD